MTLAEYLSKKTKAQRAEFAARCGVHPMSLYQISKGHRPAGLGLVLRIERETGGRVPRWTLREELKPRRAQANGKKRK